MDLTGIKAIFFDFGGVILNIDYKLTEQAFEKLGIADFKKHYSQAHQSGLFDELETGKISPKQFRDRIRESCRLNFDDHAIDNAWNAMLLDLPVERLDLLERLKKDYKVFLLSNTNVIHMKWIEAYLDKQGLKNRFFNCFDQLYFSYEMKKRKPDPETFLYVAEQNNLDPSEVLFIDDSIQHIEGAKEAGMKTYFLEKGQEVVELF